MKRKEFLELAGVLGGMSALLPGCLTDDGGQTGPGNTELEVGLFDLELRHAWTLSRGTWNSRRNCFVRIKRDGVTGMGEAAPIARYGETAEGASAFIDRARSVLDRDLWAFVERWREFDALAPGEHAAKAALDMAVLDWIGKKLNQPLWKIFGFDGKKSLTTTFSIGIDEVPIMQEKVREAEIFNVYKVKVGTPDDRKILEGIRAVTDKPLRTDANEGWTSKEEALEMITWMAQLGVELVEQPLPADRLEDNGWLKERVPIPIFADESVISSSDLPRIAPYFHGINIKLMKCGGVQEALRMAGIARALGLSLMIGCMIESSLAISAAAAITPLFDFADLDGNLLVANDPFVGVKTEVDKLVLNDKPGWGVRGDVWR